MRVLFDSRLEGDRRARSCRNPSLYLPYPFRDLVAITPFIPAFGCEKFKQVPGS
jgi:hypothetical protein